MGELNKLIIFVYNQAEKEALANFRDLEIRC